MNVKSLFTVAVLFAAAAGAHAALPDEYALHHNDPQPAASPAAAPRSVPLLQRAQVAAEARQARRLGLIAEGDAPAPVATAAQIAQLRQAGLDAVQHQLAAQ